MKKSLAAVLAIIFVVCMGCEKIQKPSEKQLPGTFSAKMEMNYNGTRTFSDILINGDSFHRTVTQPEDISGLTIEGKAGKYTVKFDGKIIDSDNKNSSYYVFASSFLQALKNAESGSQTAVRNGDTVVYSGDSPYGGYLLTTNPAAGIITEFSIKSIGMDAVFTNFVTQSKDVSYTENK